MIAIARGAFEACQAFAEASGGERQEWLALNAAQRADVARQVEAALVFGADEPTPKGRLFIATARAISNAIATAADAENAFKKSADRAAMYRVEPRPAALRKRLLAADSAVCDCDPVVA